MAKDMRIQGLCSQEEVKKKRKNCTMKKNKRI